MLRVLLVLGFSMGVARADDAGEASSTPLAQAPALACVCEPDGGTRLPAFECSADVLPEGAALCQRSEAGLHCAPVGNNPETFFAESGCDPGFCISLDGRTCAAHCGCTEPGEPG
ncbi:MAG: hypothetical protein H6704_12175 [Myxococcales bacterium]|nr:hypothetical protein [Myxococcales bacterium]